MNPEELRNCLVNFVNQNPNGSGGVRVAAILWDLIRQISDFEQAHPEIAQRILALKPTPKTCPETADAQPVVDIARVSA